MRGLFRLILLLPLLLAVPAHAAWTIKTMTALLAVIDRAGEEGLDPRFYEQSGLRAALDAGNLASASVIADRAYAAIARDFAAGRTPAEARQQWFMPSPAPGPEAIAARMAAAQADGRVAESLHALLPTHPQYLGLKGALAATASDKDAARDILRINLDRWRWMPRNLGDRHLIVNVPAFEAQLVQGGKPVATHRVIVGATRTPTPQFAAVATGVVFNPPWVVPQSIVRESVGGLIRSNPTAARARGYSWSGVGKGLSVTQAPGPNNALGQVKIDMPNPHSVFLHDTPNKGLFDRTRRALSHGCIRTEGIADLAGRLLDDWDRQRIASVLDSRVTTRVPLAAQLPVFITYFTAAIGANGELRLFPDLYGRDAPVLAALNGGAMAVPAESLAAFETECQAAMPNLPA